MQVGHASRWVSSDDRSDFGAAEVVAVIRLRTQVRSQALLAFVGSIAVIGRLVVVVEPAPGVFAVAVVLGVYALLTGGVLLAPAARIRRLG